MIRSRQVIRSQARLEKTSATRRPMRIWLCRLRRSALAGGEQRTRASNVFVIEVVTNRLFEEEVNMSAESKTTTNHDEIKQWVEERGGRPAIVKGTEKGDSPGVLRIDYPGFTGEDTLEPITWEEFFEAFDE